MLRFTLYIYSHRENHRYMTHAKIKKEKKLTHKRHRVIYRGLWAFMYARKARFLFFILLYISSLAG